ncbi:MAG: glycosyltransferase family 2 protein [Marmoricola sp.]|nr:glycosyltransferase family 2 protein [Marmoricola sp.]
MSVAALLLASGASAVALVLLLRWGVWPWLGVVAAVPAGIVQTEVPTAAGVSGLLLGVALVTWCWRRPVGPTRATVGLLAAAGSVVVALRSDTSSWSVGSLPTAVWACLAVCVALAAAAAVGLGRSRCVPLRWACLLAVVAPAVLAVVTVKAMALAQWLPVAAALGVTGLLRGARGRAASRSQLDEVDAAALARFDEAHGPLALPPVAIVIAAYDEEAGIGPVLETLPGTVCGLAARTIVVDDCSTDATADVAEASGALVARCGANRGQGAALRLGYRLARDHGASYVITTDADGQYDVADMPIVLAPVLEDRADFVTGSRRLGHQPVQDPLRRLGVHVFAWLVSALVGHRLTDTSFGLRAMRAEATAEVTLNQPQYQSSELLIGMVSHGHRVLEVPGRMNARSSGASKKGPNWIYGRRYAGVVLGTWWREGCPSPIDRCPALRGPAPQQAHPREAEPVGVDDRA